MRDISLDTNECLSLRSRIGYGSGDYALNLFWQGVGFYLFFFYTDVLGLPNATAGFIFAIGGLWDALSDPLMGYIAERTKSKWGIYRPYLLFGSLPLALSFILLFSQPPLDEGNFRLLYILIVLLIFRTSYTIVSIPYSALSTRLTHNSKERTKIAGVRMYCGFLGALTVIGLSSLLQANFADEQAFLFLAGLCAIISIFTLYYCFRNTREQVSFSVSCKPATSVKQIAKSLRRNKPFILLLIALIFVTVANTILGKMLLYFFEYNLNDRMAGNTAIFIMIGTPLITIPVWTAVALAYGKRLTWIYGCIIAGIGFAWLFFDRSQNIPLALIKLAVITLGLSSFTVLLWSMLPDTIDYGEYHTGIRNESTVVGILSSAQKASLAGSAFIIGIALDKIGYEAGKIQTAETMDGLYAIISLIPLGALVLSLLAISFYPLSANILIRLREKAFRKSVQ